MNENDNNGNETVQAMYARCGKYVKVGRVDNSFITIETCPAGHMARMEVGQLLNKCGDCTFTGPVTIVKQVEGKEVPLTQPTSQARQAALDAAKAFLTGVQQLSSSAPSPTPSIKSPEVEVPVLPLPIPQQDTFEMQSCGPLEVEPTSAPLHFKAVSAITKPVEFTSSIHNLEEANKAFGMPDIKDLPLPGQVTSAPSMVDQIIEEEAKSFSPTMPDSTIVDLPVVAMPKSEPGLGPIIVDKKDYPKDDKVVPEQSFFNTGMSEMLGLPPVDDEDKVDIEKVLKECLGELSVGPSKGGISAHSLMECKCARKAYYYHVLGLRKSLSEIYYRFGSLFHACMAVRYTGGDYNIVLDRVAQAGAPKLSGEVRRLVSTQVDKYALEEYETWCPRGVEANLVAFVPAKVDKKTVHIPLSTRIDLILGLKGKHEAHPGPGPLSSGVWLLDWKTASQITYNLVTGYGMDYQFLVQDAIYLLGGFEEEYGPLNGNMVSIAGKGKKADESSFHREHVPYSKKMVNEFIQDQLIPQATDIYTRLLIDAPIENWKKDNRQCESGFGKRCAYFEICDGKDVSTAIGYKQDIKAQLKIENMKPYKVLTKPKEVKEVPVENMHGPAIGIAEQVLPSPIANENKDGNGDGNGNGNGNGKGKLAHAAQVAFATALVSMIESDERYSVLRKEKYLENTQTPEGVVKQLTADLKVFYAPLAEQKVSFPLQDIKYTFKKTGLGWSVGTEKGSVSWKSIAETICQIDWFNLSKVLADDGSSLNEVP